MHMSPLESQRRYNNNGTSYPGGVISLSTGKTEINALGDHLIPYFETDTLCGIDHHEVHKLHGGAADGKDEELEGWYHLSLLKKAEAPLLRQRWRRLRTRRDRTRRGRGGALARLLNT